MTVDVKRIEWIISAKDQASPVLKSLQGSVMSLQSSWVALSGALAGGLVFTKFISDAIALRSALDDMADTTGDSVQTLDGLRKVAGISGVSLEQLGGALTKLARNLNAADDDGKAAGEAIKAIGLSVEQLKAKKPGEAMFEIAQALSRFEDGSSKVAVAMALMGREGAKLLPYLKDLAEEGQLNGKITNEQAAAAEALEKNWRRLNAEMQSGKSQIATEVIPVMSQLLAMFREAVQISGSLPGGAFLFGATRVTEEAGPQIAAIDAKVKTLLETRGALMGDSIGARLNRLVSPEDIAIVDAQLAHLDRQRRLLLSAQRLQALAGGGKDSAGETARFMRRAELRFTIPKKEGTPEKPAENAYDALKRQFEEMLARGKELTQVEQAVNLFQTERYQKARRESPPLAAAREKEILDLARIFDERKRLEETEKEAADERKKRDREHEQAMLKHAQEVETLREKYVDLIDVNYKYAKALEEIDKAQRIGAITADQAVEARRLTYMRQFEEQNRQHEKQIDLWKDFGVAATSSLEDVILRSKTAKDAILEMGRAIGSIVWRQQITNPIASGLSSYFGSGNLSGVGGVTRGSQQDIMLAQQTAGMGGGSLLDGIRSLFGFAAGGSFDVSGVGGIDSQVVAFRATPGERVTVQTPSQQGGDALHVTQHIHFEANTPAAVRDAVLSMMPVIQRASVDAVNDARRRGR